MIAPHDHSPNSAYAGQLMQQIDWSVTSSDIPPAKCLNLRFEEQVGRTPNSIALAFEETSLSYAGLNRAANRLAHYLIELGVGPEALVAVCAEPGLEMIVAILAVLKAGGAYLPLDPAFPGERIRFMLDDAAPVAVLTQAPLRPDFSDADRCLRILDISAENPPWSGYPDTNPDTASMGLHDGSLAHVIYTSGSTGRPKGVLIEHRALNVLVDWFIRECNLTSEFVSLPATSFAFSAFYKNIYAPLFIGGQIRLVKTLKDTKSLLATVSRENVQLLNERPRLYPCLLTDQPGRVIQGQDHHAGRRTDSASQVIAVANAEAGDRQHVRPGGIGVGFLSSHRAGFRSLRGRDDDRTSASLCQHLHPR